VVRPAQDELARAEMALAAEKVEGEVRALTDQIERVLRTVRDWGRNGQLQLAAPGEFSTLLIPLLRSRPQISSVLIANQRGQAALFGRDEKGGWLLRLVDYDKLGARQHWLRMNAEGGYLGEEWATVDFDARTRPWYLGASKLSGDDDIFWTDPYVFLTGKEPGISAGMRWTDRNTGVAHVAAFDVRLIDLSRQTTRLAVGTHGRVALLSSDGRLLGVPRHPRVASDDDIRARLLKTPEEAGFAYHATALRQWNADGQPPARTSVLELEGEAWLARFRKLPLRNQTLVIGTVVPRSDFAFGTRWDALALGALMLSVLVLAFLIGRRFSARFGSVMQSLASESERIGAMQLDTPVRVTTRLREIHALVAAQERMRQALLEATRGLEDKVEARTRELAERETFTRSLLESSASGLILSTPQGEIRHITARWSEIIGFSLEELRAKSSGDLYAEPEDRARFVELLNRDGGVRNFETRFLKKSGEPFWGLLNSTYVDVGGERLIASWVHDISEQREAAEQIRLLADEQKLVLENVQAGILFTGDSKILRCNPRFAELFGYADPKQVVGIETRALFPDDAEFQRFSAVAGPQLAAGKALDAEWRAARRDGSVFLGHARARAIQVPGYRFATIWIVEDVTERRAAERQITTARAQLQAIIDGMPLHVFMKDLERRYLRVNRPFTDFFGVERDWVIGRRDSDFPTEGDRSEGQVRDTDREVLEEGKSLQFEQRVTDAKGTPRDFLVEKFPLRDGEGKIYALAGVATDVTERKVVEDALKQANFLSDVALELTGSGYWHVDYSDPDHYRLSERGARILGEPPRQDGRYHLQDEWFARLLEADPEGAARTAEHYQAAIEGRTDKYQSTYAYKRPADGRVVWIQAAGKVVRDEATGAIRHMYGAYLDITESKSSEQALRESQAQLASSETYFRTIFENSGSAIVSRGKDRGALRANKRYLDFVGYSLEELEKLDTPALIHEADRDAAREHLERLRRGEIPSYRLERRYRRKDGQVRWAEAVTSAILDAGGSYAGSVTIINDMTERKTAEEALRSVNAEQSAIFESATSGIALVRDRAIQRCNRKLEEIFGYAPGEFLGKPTRIWYSSDEEFALGGGGVYEQLARGETHRREQRFVRKDGSVFWCRLTGRAVNPADVSQGSVWMLEDVSEERAAADALKQARDRIGAIFESASTGIAMVQGSRIRLCNRKLEEIFGYAPGEFQDVPTRIWYRSDEEYAQGSSKGLAHVAQGEIFRNERIFVRKDGSTFWCRLTGRAIDAADLAKGTVWMLEDVSDERAAAEALREAKRAAEDATQAKSMFLANMSHEIRTPMNAIIGMSHLALKTDLNAKQRDYVSKVHNAGTSLLGIINDILDFSKVEAGKLDIEQVPFRLDDVLANVSSVIAQKAYDKGLELVFDVAPDLPQALVGDPLRLGQILTNLINNAVKFTERGQISVVVRRADRAGEKVQLSVSVRDTGIGMTREQSGKLFQAFTQADGSTTRKYGGTGLGLTISKRLVELMGGAIAVESKPGVGSAFSFTAWFGLGDEAALPRKVVPDALNGQRVLVVDDNASAREILAEMLRGLHFSVSTADSGDKALAAVAAARGDHPFGITFLDWKMPGMDGLETARRLHQDQPAPRMVMVTAFGLEEVREGAGLAGIEAFLVKPVSQSALVDALVGMFAPAPGAAQAALQAGEAHSLYGVRLLLAEDNEINQQIAVELLQGAGAQVEVAGNGRLALEMLASHAPTYYDAVLMDLQMPEMDGFEATAGIRADARLAKLPIIAMTAHAMVEERERCLKAGMVDHITKPIDPEAMFRTLARWVRPATAGAPAAANAIPGPERLPEIEGLDAAGGLKRVAGNRRLYLSLLRQFCDRQADAGLRVAAALAAQDRGSAERVAHTVKGVAGNIGFTNLASLAGALEKALHADRGVRGALSKFEAALARDTAALADALPAEAAAAAPADAAGAAPHVATLARLLAASDGDALDCLAAHEGALRAVFAERQFGVFAEAVNGFDFDTALAQLQQAATAHGIDLGGGGA
jgi:PAS domain S-box-containing protein